MRHGLAVRLRDAAERVLRARAVLHGEDAETFWPERHAADRVRHVEAGALLADDDRADVAAAAASMIGLSG